MRPEDVAKNYAYQRPNHELVGYAEVGLPFYRLTIRAFTLERKKIPPIEEFVLMAINQGLNTLPEVAGFLGLKKTVVMDAMTNLVRSEDVFSLINAESNQRFVKLTPNGERTLIETRLLMIEERTFPFFFDTLLRRIDNYPNESFYAPKQLKQAGLLEIKASLAKAPEVSELSFNDVERVIRRIGYGDDAKRDLISIKAIERKERFFRYAVALHYRSKVSNESQIAFVVDGKLSDSHENAYATAISSSKLGMEMAFLDVSLPHSAIQFLPPELRDTSPSPEQSDQIRQQMISAEQQVEFAQRELEQAANRETRVKAEEHLQNAEQQLNDTRKIQWSLPVRFLSVYEHPEILRNALQDSRKRLMIIAPWVRNGVVNNDFLQQLEILLQRGVTVYIGYGIGENDPQKKPPADEYAKNKLDQLCRQYKNFWFKYFGFTHEKILLYDTTCVVITSFNWLSFRGDPYSPYRAERGTLLAMPQLIEEMFNTQLNYFLEEADALEERQPSEKTAKYKSSQEANRIKR
jgi:hypothetical protein